MNYAVHDNSDDDSQEAADRFNGPTAPLTFDNNYD